MDASPLLRHPAAWFPLAMSLIALALVLGYAASVGVARQPGADEGAPARLFQLLLAAQLPVIAWFGVTWLPRRPRAAVAVLALQAVAWLAPVVVITALEA